LTFANRTTVPSQELFCEALAAPAQQIDDFAHELAPLTAVEQRCGIFP
jgi:hypothetical protein